MSSVPTLARPPKRCKNTALFCSPSISSFESFPTPHCVTCIVVMVENKRKIKPSEKAQAQIDEEEPPAKRRRGRPPKLRPDDQVRLLVSSLCLFQISSSSFAFSRVLLRTIQKPERTREERQPPHHTRRERRWQGRREEHQPRQRRREKLEVFKRERRGPHAPQRGTEGHQSQLRYVNIHVRLHYRLKFTFSQQRSDRRPAQNTAPKLYTYHEV